MTMKDISELAGVSMATVSRFVNGSGYVSIETGMRIRIAISRLRYCPNAYAATLARMGRGVRKKSGIRSHAFAPDEDRIDSKPRY
jgi:DNA-binding LacI/PurR family transcriptional regulator